MIRTDTRTHCVHTTDSYVQNRDTSFHPWVFSCRAAVRMVVYMLNELPQIPRLLFLIAGGYSESTQKYIRVQT